MTQRAITLFRSAIRTGLGGWFGVVSTQKVSVIPVLGPGGEDGAEAT